MRAGDIGGKTSRYIRHAVQRERDGERKNGGEERAGSGKEESRGRRGRCREERDITAR